MTPLVLSVAANILLFIGFVVVALKLADTRIRLGECEDARADLKREIGLQQEANAALLSKLGEARRGVGK